MSRLLASLALCTTLALPGLGHAQPSKDEGPAPISTRGPLDLTPAELEILEDLERNVWPAYASAAANQDARMRSILLREYNLRLAKLNKRYALKLAAAEKAKRRHQLASIALLEKFLKDHPDHRIYTPDAMYRLAALYLDEAEMSAAADVDADYSRSLALWERIIRDFTDFRQYAGALYLYATYVPTRQSTDPLEERRALQVYLALVCANKFKPMDAPPEPPTREDSLARLENRVLVDSYSDCQALPPERGADDDLVLYAWVRGVAPAHFGTPGEMDEAIASYKKGTADDSTKLYDEALYMTGWSYYRRDFLPEAIDLFDKSVVRYDKVVAAGGKPGLELRDEALQYIAVSFTDPWENEVDVDPAKAFARAEAFYTGREAEPHVREVWKVMGNAFVDLGGNVAFERAVDSYEKSISKPWHLHPENPLTHEKIVEVLTRMGATDRKNEESQRLATRYAPCPAERKSTRSAEDECGRWYEANETNRAAMENQRRIGERMLVVAAFTTYEEAIVAYKEWQADPDNVELSARKDKLLAASVELYRSFLDQYPQSTEYYTYTYNLAEALFFSGKYDDRPGADGTIEQGALPYYRWVRDHKDLGDDPAVYTDSVFKIVKSLEAEAEILLAAGAPGLRNLEIPNLENVARPVQALEVPAIHSQLRDAYDDYARRVNEPKEAPITAYRAALVSITYLDLDDSIARFQIVVDKFCGLEQATLAKEGILQIHLAREDAEAFRKTNTKFIAAKCGDTDALAKAVEQNRELDFTEANKLANAGDLEKSAEAFYRYYKTTPADDPKRAGALYNSASLYQEAGKPKTALALFKEFSRHTESKAAEDKVFRESPQRLPSMRRTATSYRDVYDYKAAAKIYLQIYKLADKPGTEVKPPPAPAGGGKAPTFEEIKRDALFNAAVFLELDRDSAAAITYYRRYIKVEPDKRKKDRALWAVARIHRSNGKLYDLDKTYAEWRKLYGKSPSNQNDLIFTYFDLAKLYGKKAGGANQKKADGYRKSTISAWEGISSAAWTKLASTNEGKVLVKQAALMAGEFDLYYAEQHYQKKWLTAKITKRAKDPKAAAKLITELENKALAAIKVWDDLGQKYRPTKTYITEYALANQVRVGDIYLGYNERVFNIPVPSETLKMDKKYPDKGILGMFEAALRKELEKKGYRDTAKRAFEQVVTIANNANISNKWVTYAKDQLNKEFGGTYQILTDELIDGTEEP